MFYGVGYSFMAPHHGQGGGRNRYEKKSDADEHFEESSKEALTRVI